MRIISHTSLKYGICVSAILSASLITLPQILSQARAEEDVINVTALRPISFEDATTAVQVLDEADLQVRSSVHVADQLRAVPGAAISRAGAVGGLTQLRSRGSEGNHTLVLVDGIEVSDPVTGETDLGLWSSLPLKRIEYARGEQSSLYGSDAIGGLVSLTTGGEGVVGHVEAGSFDTRRAELGYAGGNETLSFSAFGSYFDTEGVDTSGFGGGRDGSQSRSVFLRGGYQLNQAWRANALLIKSVSDVSFDSDTDFDGRLNDVDRETENDQTLFGLSLQGSAWGADHQLRASFSEIERDDTSDGVPSGITEGERLKLVYSPSVKFDNSTFSAVASALVDYEKEDYARVGFGFSTAATQRQDFETIGLAGEVRLRAGNFVANISTRYDDNDGQFDDVTTWRVGGAYNFNFGGKVRASIGTGVKNPTFTELFGFFPGSFIGNPSLEPETSESWEIGWDQNFEKGAFSITYFDAELEDEIFSDFSNFPLTNAANREGRSERNGVEVSVEIEPVEGIQIQGAFTDISSQNDSGENEIRVPQNTGSLSILVTPPTLEKLSFSFAGDYVGEQGDTDFGSFTPVTLDAYTLFTGTVSYDLNDKMTFSVRGENLTDEEVFDILGFHQTGRGVFIGLRVAG